MQSGAGHCGVKMESRKILKERRVRLRAVTDKRLETRGRPAWRAWDIRCPA